MNPVRTLLMMLTFCGTAVAAEPHEKFFDPFLGDLRAEIAEAKRLGRKGVVIMYHFEECPYCARMKREVLSRPEVQEAYRADFIVIAIDTRGSQPVSGMDGRIFPENEFAKQQMVRATPTFDFYGTDAARAYRHAGGIFDPAEFLLLGRYVASGEHRSSTFDEYKQKLKGS
ncbi:MAG TPA: thioredoxin fold domain-containing protein [Burkholderiales bacterium]|nr:thioredoxin fold domain-containing protein [Burkholderiales bacterium]